MIQKRYKQTAKLAVAESLKVTFETLPIILAEIPLPEIEDRPNHNQILRVRDVNVALCVNYIGITPKRVLIHKVTKLEIETSLFVPKWEILSSTFSAQVNAEGEREMHEMEWFNDETNEAVTKEEVSGVDENGEVFTEEKDLPELEDEVYLLPSIPYLMMFASQVPLPSLIEKFSKQVV